MSSYRDWYVMLVCLLLALYAGAGAQSAALTTEVPSSVVGPNVCRSRYKNYCCPGWKLKPGSSLCVLPVCWRHCGDGRCIKPNICVCENGAINMNCSGKNSVHVAADNGVAGNITVSSCPFLCLNGGTCENGKCICKFGYVGEYCGEPICRDGCLNGGRCIGPDRCACVYGYAGKRCEADYRVGPCFRKVVNDMCLSQLENVVCTKQLCCATIGRAWGHPCEHCPLQLDCDAGFLKNIHSGQCVDIDECEAIPDLCEGGICLNTIGSFQCVCPAGKVRNLLTNICEDENECKSDRGKELCGHGQCVNTDGSYFCLCQNGYIATHDRKHCIDASQGKCYIGVNDRKQCIETLPIKLSKIDCCCGKNIGKAWGDDCEFCPAPGSDGYAMLCQSGGSKSTNGTVIMPVDECALRPGICGGGRCINTAEAFFCDCYPGYEKRISDDVQVCEDVDECLQGLCKEGQCLNSPGSFQCLCPAGFDATSDGRLCIDHDECTENGMCANGICINMDGSFKCLCNSGYVLSLTGHACVDIDECFENPRICLSGRCHNTAGGYRCECQSGFTLTPDGGFCVDMNECLDNNLCENGRCVNTEGSFRCVCNTGYHLSADKRTCVDFDECVNSVCFNGRCVNTLGSFRCECPHGFYLGHDGRTCQDSTKDLCYTEIRNGLCMKPSQPAISKSSCCCSTSTSNNSMAWGTPCTPCSAIGSAEYLALCPHGTGMTFTGEDINECSQNPFLCENGACENLMGTYRCICNRGYKPDASGKICLDINECDDNLVCHGGQCKNIPGDYQCTCPLGTRFNATSSVCDDVNECNEQINDVCKNGKCINTFGSFLCECPVNAILDNTGRVCLDNRRGSCWTKVTAGRCENNLPRLNLKKECCCSIGLAWGSPCELCQDHECDCAKGYAKVDGKVCSDVNECELNSGLCRGGGTCVNTEGSFLCVCPAGLTLDSIGTMCQDTRLDTCYADYKYGTGASPVEGVFTKSTCCCSTIGKAWGGGGKSEHCPRPGTVAFNDLCPKGYGFVERKDINECVEFPEICINGRCKNTIGSFNCTCSLGFAHNENGLQCLDIDECNIMHGVCGEAGECHNIPGSFECKCKDGFESHPTMHVCVDINECQRTPNLCRNGNCINDIGSYHCECPEGHELAPDKQSCKDIDECSRTSGICSNGLCENMLGTYQCICENGFQQTDRKSHCEDIDECMQLNGGCENVCVNTPGSYFCDCGAGQTLMPDGRSCRDIDECTENPHICNGGDCSNTIGSYTCSCGSGLLIGPNDSVCIDVNECDIKEHNVCGNGDCINTVGSFSCNCEEGYSMKSEYNPYCSDDDECTLDTHSCDRNAICVNNPGSYSCRCLDGFNGNGFTCLDINECLTNNGGCHKNAQCVNTDGSFKCICDEGFRGDGFMCEDIDDCLDNRSLCENGNCVNYPGSYRCECDMGFMNLADGDQKSCTDIDECQTFENLCIFGKCVNMVGTFRCECNPGYQPDNTGGNCTDINECDSPQACLFGNCTNNEGSFACKCPPNYQLTSSGNACVDRRESRCYMAIEDRAGKKRCSMDTGNPMTKATCCCTLGKAWGGRCELCPPIGSEEFRQLCPGGPGYRPNTTTVMLEDVNECEEHLNLCKNGHCTNTFGGYMCLCNEGFRLDAAEAFCNDIDECAENPDICGLGFCINDEGSYHCICPDGYMAMRDGKECTDFRKEKCFLNYTLGMCMEPMSNPQSRMICCCSMGQAWGSPCLPCPALASDEYTQLCGNRPGQVTNPLTNTTEEIDECALMPQMCKHGRCVNTPGSFQCVCDLGYVYEEFSHQCIDENECLNTPNPCQGNSRCVNNPGSYECHCPKGYKLGLKMNDCIDINECAEQEDICMHGECTNLEGSFQCTCRDGYTLNTLRDKCIDVDECQRTPNICKNGTCENFEGFYKCHCYAGFKLSHNNDCIDIDECTMMPHLCRNGRCKNTLGSFHCECVDGYTLTSDGEHCKDIDECKEQGGSCHFPGHCQNVMGSYFCICPSGYRLTQNRTFCEDINECVETHDSCKGGQCINADGGFKCKCAEGFIINSAGTECVDTRLDRCYTVYSQGMCSNPRNQQVTRKECCCLNGVAWGHHCETCPAMNSTEFETLCPMGIGRSDRGEDLNECTLIPNVCQGGECINTDGSFRCDCPTGFVLDSSGIKCVDDDECKTNRSICGNGVCINLLGSFECACNEGFAPGPNQTCEDVDECLDLSHQCAFRCHNTLGSYRCTCPYGYQLAEDGRHCQDLDECLTPANNCKYKCKNLIGSYACYCPDGFTQMNSTEDCVDTNECLVNPNICANGRCVNLEGGYKCECNIGFKTSPDGKRCIDERTGYCYRKNNIVNGRCAHYNVSSKQITKADCCCTMGAAWGPVCTFCPALSSHEYQQLCLTSGFNIEGRDIDECSTMPDLCVNGKCLNTVGSYRCSCNKGYKNDHSGTKCIDINECLMSPSPCQMSCENTDGGYQCGCAHGYVLNIDNSTCRDVDECVAGTHICQQKCVNTNGSYECACNPGYKQVKGHCLDFDECSQNDVCPPPGMCINTFGSYRCVCPKGMKLHPTNSFCIEGTDKWKGVSNGGSQDGNEANKPNGNHSGGTDRKQDSMPNSNGHHGGSQDGNQANRPNGNHSGGADKKQDSKPNSNRHHNGGSLDGNQANKGNDGKEDSKHNNNNNQGNKPNENPSVGDNSSSVTTDANVHENEGSNTQHGGSANEEHSRHDGESHTWDENSNGHHIGNGDKNAHPVICKGGKCVPQLCPIGFSKHPDHNECVDNNECLQSPCGTSQCINTVGSYQCVCADGFVFDDISSDCVEMEDGCAKSPCTFGCTPLDINDYVCGCPLGYQRIGQGHCLSTVNSPVNLNSIPNLGENIPTFPIDTASGDSKVISTEGCFSCKLNEKSPPRHRRTIANHNDNFINNVTLRHQQQWKEKPSHIELLLTYDQIMLKTYILNLQPSTRDSQAEYVLEDSEYLKFFSLQNENNVWTLYMKPGFEKELTELHIGIIDKVDDEFKLNLKLIVVP